MIADVLKLVDNTKMLKYKDEFISTKDCRQKDAVDEYCLMDDRLIYLIYNTKEENVAKARDIIDRIHCRDFYKCILEKPVTKEPSPKEKKKINDELVKALKKQLEQSNRDILEKLSQNGDPGLEVIRMKEKRIDYGNENENPIKKVYFYGKEEKQSD